MVDLPQLLAPPVNAGLHGRRWLATELTRRLCEHVGIAGRGHTAAHLRQLLEAEWARGASPSLDDLLTASLEGAGNAVDTEMPGRLLMALRFVEAAPELGRGGVVPARFAENMLGIRAAAMA